MCHADGAIQGPAQIIRNAVIRRHPSAAAGRGQPPPLAADQFDTVRPRAIGCGQQQRICRCGGIRRGICLSIETKITVITKYIGNQIKRPDVRATATRSKIASGTFTFIGLYSPTNTSLERANNENPIAMQPTLIALNLFELK